MRRWVLPVIVMIVGGSLAWWGASRETRRMRAIAAQVHSICVDLSDGRDLQGRVDPRNTTSERLIIERLRRAMEPADTASLMNVRVHSGDLDEAAGRANPATHVATLMLGEVELLHLRVRCSDPDRPITIVGYAEPDAFVQSR